MLFLLIFHILYLAWVGVCGWGFSLLWFSKIFICFFLFYYNVNVVAPLLLQTQVIAAAAAGVAAEGLSPKNARMEAENAAQLSVALVENAIVILMLVEDHLRLQSKLYCASCFPTTSASPLSNVIPVGNQASSTVNGETLDPVSNRNSSSNDAGGLSLDVCLLLYDRDTTCISDP